MPYASCTRWVAQDVEVQIHRGCFWSPAAAQNDLSATATLVLDSGDLVLRNALGQPTHLDELDVHCAISQTTDGRKCYQQRSIEVHDLTRFLAPTTQFRQVSHAPSRLGLWSGVFDQHTLATPNNFDSIIKTSNMDGGVFLLNEHSSHSDPDAIIPMTLDTADLEHELVTLAAMCILHATPRSKKELIVEVRKLAYEDLGKHWRHEPIVRTLVGAPSLWVAEIEDLSRSSLKMG